MHELSIVESILDIVEGEATKAGAIQIKELELEIGMLAGIEFESMEFALKVIAPGSIIEKAKIVIKKPGGLALCSECGEEFSTDSPINSCPKCDSFSCSIIGGKELRVSSILIE